MIVFLEFFFESLIAPPPGGIACLDFRYKKYSTGKFIYIYTLFVCPFVSNKRLNGFTDRAQILCGTSRDRSEGLWMIKISKISLQQNSILIKFWKSTKFFVFCFVLQCTLRAKMFPIEIEDGREAAWKPSNINTKKLINQHKW